MSGNNDEKRKTNMRCDITLIMNKRINYIQHRENGKNIENVFGRVFTDKRRTQLAKK